MEPYETLTDAATIARRVIALPLATEDVGAMLLRQLVWRLRQKVGDGSATAAVLAVSMMEEGRRYIAAGANPMRLRKGIELGVAAAVAALQEMAEPLDDRQRMAALATAACGNSDLGRMVGEIMEIVGPEGAVNIEEYAGNYLDRDYIEGVRVKGSYSSRSFLGDSGSLAIRHERPWIFISEWNFEAASEVQPLLEMVKRDGEGRPLIVISSSQTGTALNTLLANHSTGVMPICGVILKAVGDALRASLIDLALITGGRFLPRQEQPLLLPLHMQDLGQATSIQVNEDYLTIFEGARDRKAVRQRRQTTRKQLENADDPEQIEILRESLGRLGSGVGILRIGAPTAKEREILRRQAEQAVRVVGAGSRYGVVPGGGAAYLACVPAVRAVPADGDVAVGVAIVARALEEVMRRIVASAGLYPPTALAQCIEYGKGYGVDVRTGEVTDIRQAGIMDSMYVLQVALESAGSSAGMVLTTGAVVHHRKPERCVEP
jgi:chaperonin GroEL